MRTTIDKAGRVTIPAAIRKRLHLHSGTKLEIRVAEDLTIRLRQRVAGPKLVRKGNRWVARPTVPLQDLPPIDLAALVRRERDRWPAWLNRPRGALTRS